MHWREKVGVFPPLVRLNRSPKSHHLGIHVILRADLQYSGEGLRSVKNTWPIHGYMRQMMDVPEKN